MPHTRGRCDGRQKGRERGYYYLHRNLNDPLLHDYSLFTFHYSLTLVVSETIAAISGARVDTQRAGLSRHREAAAIHAF